MRPSTLLYPSRRSPSIRSPSLLQQSSDLQTRPRSLTPHLPRPWFRSLQLVITLIVAWFEYGTFWLAGKATNWTCNSSSSSASGGGGQFNVLIVTDPQLLDIDKSYPGRNKALKWLTIEITNRFMKKSWYFLSTTSKIDAVVWNGDLLDNGREMNSQEYTSHTRLFHKLFPLPRLRPRHSLGASHLDPPIPVIYVPGNHDLPLHPTTSFSSLNTSRDGTTTTTTTSIAGNPRQQFVESFGRLWGSHEWNGWNFVWIDSIALVEPDFFHSQEPQSREMRSWIEEELGRRGEKVKVPRILLSHVPLFRERGTKCGRDREGRDRWGGGIRDGYGKGYQNLVGKVESDWLMERVRPEKVFSGDDHDYCFVSHKDYVSPFDGITPVTETTVKSFSMAMGVSHPGFTFLSLDPPGVSQRPTFVERSCLLPSQLGIYLHVYLPLSITLFLFFLVPNLLVVLRGYLARRQKRRRRRRQGGRQAAKRRWNATRKGGGRRGKTFDDENEKGSEGEEAEEGDEDSFPTPSLGGSATDVGEYGYSADLGGGGGGREDSGPVSNRPRTGSVLFDNDAESEQEEDEDEGENYESRRGNSRRGSKVRRVSRVWLWDKDNNNNNGTSPRIMSTGLPATRYDYSDEYYDYDASTLSRYTTRLKDFSARLLNRLSQNSLLVPFLRLFRPLLRLVRVVLFLLCGKPLELGVRLLGGEKGIARAFREAATEFSRLVSGGLVVWIVVWIWIGL